MFVAICLLSRVKLNNTSSRKISAYKSKVYKEVRKIAPARKCTEYNCSSVLKNGITKEDIHSQSGSHKNYKASCRSLAETVTGKEFLRVFMSRLCLACMFMYTLLGGSSGKEVTN